MMRIRKGARLGERIMKAAALVLAASLAATHAVAVPMTAWDASKDGNPKTYDIGGLTLTLSSVKDRTASFPVLSIRAKGALPLVIRGDNGGFAAASFGVGHFDPKDGGDQVVFTYYTGGAHCCRAGILAEHWPGGWKTVDLGQWDGGFATPPVDIDGDGAVDFVFVDQRFLYAFGCFACGHAPPEVMNVIRGRVRDVSAAPGFRQLYEH